MMALDLRVFVDTMLQRHKEKQIDGTVIFNAIKNSIAIDLLVNNLAEALRLPQNEIEKDLREFGFGDLIDQHKIKAATQSDSKKDHTSKMMICNRAKVKNPYPDLFEIRSRPSLSEPVYLPEHQKETFHSLFQTVPATFSGDPFVGLYRQNILAYFKDFMGNYATLIKKEIELRFKGGYPRYLVTTGIGANEQFSHFVASLNNADKGRRITWLIIDSPRRLSLLPEDATVDNTLFMEFSRSSVTEETIKIHEYTPRNANRIVFSNSGPLREIGKRDGNLVLGLPDEVSGRFGRNKTPILLAPMYAAGMDVEAFWTDIDDAITNFDLADPDSLPFVLAKFILMQQQSSRNLIYLGCNDDNLLLLADEFVQFWNEGVNKGGNDFLISRFFGLPRDSHMNIEGLLGNCKSKLAIFLLRTDLRPDALHPLISPIIDPINGDHEGLHFGDEEAVLSIANYRRFSDLMPTLLFEIPTKPSLKHAAVIGQLFADVTYIYSRLLGIDPGSNPEVKAVRHRSAELLSEAAREIRRNNSYSIGKGMIRN